MIQSYLQSSAHRYGCIAAILACILILFGAFGRTWVVMIILFYLGGFIFSLFVDSGVKEQHIEKTVQPNTPPLPQPVEVPVYNAPIHEKLVSDFKTLERNSNTHLSREAKRLMQEIDSIMQFMSNKIQQSNDQAFKFEISDIQRTMTAYLSPALEHYCQLPSFLRDRTISEMNATPTQLLEQQLALILEELKKIAESIYVNDLNQVIDHGQFLKQKLQHSTFFKIESE